MLRRRLSPYGEENIRNLLQMQKADYFGKGVTDNTPPFELVEALIENILAEEHCLHLRDLAVNGKDLMTVGVPEGKILGDALAYLLDCVLDEKLPNEREVLLNAAVLYLHERTDK